MEVDHPALAHQAVSTPPTTLGSRYANRRALSAVTPVCALLLTLDVDHPSRGMSRAVVLHLLGFRYTHTPNDETPVCTYTCDRCKFRR